MKNKIVAFLILTISIIVNNNICFAQDYKYEFGSQIGTASYLGDANKMNPYLNPHIAGGAICRLNLNLYWSLKVNAIAGIVSGNTMNSASAFPYNQQASFKRKFAEMSMQMEYNFIPFSKKNSYLGAKPYTPYIFAGIGYTYGEGERKFNGTNFPFGIGFKYKIKNRLNIGIELSLRKLFRDDFDVTYNNSNWNLNAPYGIASSRIKNKDWYSLTLLFITWELGYKHKSCC